VELGGLHIIGSERHEARRIDNQLRGRAGRQGDPGDSRFYVALDDELMRRFGGDRIRTVMEWAGLDEDAPIENRMISKSIEGAQVKVESYHFDIRKHLVDYDDVVNTHRNVIYEEREKVLRGTDLKSNIQTMVEQELRDTLGRYLGDQPPERWDVDGLVTELGAIFPLSDELGDPDGLAQMDPEEIESILLEHAAQLYEEQEAGITAPTMRSIERELMLRVIDGHWVYHLTTMENLRQGIGLQAYGQRDPLVMYKKEGHEQFQNLLARIQFDIVHNIYQLGIANAGQDGKTRGGRAKGTGGGKSVMTRATESRSREPVAAGSRKVGRNEQCPCGSGKKYKRCHGA